MEAKGQEHDVPWISLDLINNELVVGSQRYNLDTDPLPLSLPPEIRYQIIGLMGCGEGV